MHQFDFVTFTVIELQIVNMSTLTSYIHKHAFWSLILEKKVFLKMFLFQEHMYSVINIFISFVAYV